MTLENQKVIAAIVVSLIWGFMFGALVASKSSRNTIYNDAVKLGHAEWAGSEDGSPVFKWKGKP